MCEHSPHPYLILIYIATKLPASLSPSISFYVDHICYLARTYCNMGDIEGSAVAVFDTIGVPSEKLDRWLIENRASWVDMFWLADRLDTIPSGPDEGTDSSSPTNPHWRSPWIGKDIIEILDFMESIPDSHRDFIDKHHFVVLDQDLRDKGLVRVYRLKTWADDDCSYERCPDVHKNGVTFLTFSASYVGVQLLSMQGGDWEREVEAEWSHAGYDNMQHEDSNWWEHEEPRPP